MKILLGYEKTGVMRRAFRELGHDAWSCDIEQASDGSQHHLQCDIWDVAEKQEWDLKIFFPMCTYLTVSAAWAYSDGPYHQKVNAETLVGAARRDAREKAIANFIRLDLLSGPTVIENPGRSFVSKRYRRPTQIIQPYNFGDNASKATGLWLSKHFTKIAETCQIPGRYVEWPRFSGKFVERWANQTDSGQNNLGPSRDRWHKRSDTYPGIAAALADQLPIQLQRVAI